MKFSFHKSALALALFGLVGAAHATSLGFNAPVNVVAQTATFFGGTLLDTAITQISNPSYTGIARTAVYQTASGLDFYYQFANSSESINGIERFSGYNFASLGESLVDVFQTSAAFGIFSAGTESSDGADRTATGVVGFSFIPSPNSKINPGTTSFTQIIRTNATAYTAGNFGLLDGIGDNARGFATAVPEPETYAMFLAGLGMIGAIVRRRKDKQA